MSHLKRGPLPVPEYYRWSVRLTLFQLIFLVIASGTARAAVICPLLLLCLAVTTSIGDRVRRFGRTTVILLTLVMAVILLDWVVSIKSLEQLPAAGMEIISVFLLGGMVNYQVQRRYWFMILMSAVLAIGCVAFSDSLAVYGMFIAAMLTIIMSMNAANLRFRQGNQGAGTLPDRYFRQFLLVSPAGLAMSFVVFIAFPRVQAFTLKIGKMSGMNRTGYSGTVSLDGDGEISESEDLALIVESNDPSWLADQAPGILLRGDALDTFDGKAWVNSDFTLRPVTSVDDPRIFVPQQPVIRELVIHAEPTTGVTVFYPGALVRVMPQGAKGLINDAGGVVLDRYLGDQFTYTVFTGDPLPPAVGVGMTLEGIARAAADPRRRWDAKELLHAPDTARVSRLTTIPPDIATSGWFTEWVRETGIRPGDSLMAADAALKRHFAEKFTASLKNSFGSKNTFQAFLTQSRQGHCEYFASATVLLLRRFGVPARVAVGYRGGVWNDVIHAIEVREDSAHAWVEALLPGKGWISLDPTPFVPVPSIANASLLARLKRFGIAASFLLREYLVDYDLNTQRSIVSSVSTWASDTKQKSMSIREVINSAAFPIVSVFAVLIILTLVARSKFEGGRREFPDYYTLFLTLLARQGWRRDTGESLREFHQRLREAGITEAAIGPLASAIDRDLYGPPTPAASPKWLKSCAREAARQARQIRRGSARAERAAG